MMFFRRKRTPAPAAPKPPTTTTLPAFLSIPECELRADR
jgi:hypothetical protein